MNKLAVLLLVQLVALVHGSCVDTDADNRTVGLFQEYVRINTTTTVGNITAAIEFWQTLTDSEDLPMNIYYYEEGYPVIVIKWAGANSSLPSIMLNSHMDVVPADADYWTYDPFSATLVDGVIWGRGTQDMKSVSIQYFESLRRLKANNVTLLRDVYMTLMPDEETGGKYGMIPFINSPEHAAMNVGFGMDEGGASPLTQYALLYQDKAVWQIQIVCTGTAAHSALLKATNTTAAGKCRNVIDTLLDFRDEQYEVAAALTSSLLQAGEFTVVNLNKMNAGIANNVVPEEVTLVFDIRLATALNTTAFAEQLEDWIDASGDNITITYLQQDPQSAQVVTNSSNPYYVALQEAAAVLNITLYPLVSPGATDARQLRLKGIPAFGFSPMSLTTALLHTDNERLAVDTFLEGIQIYCEIIPSLANIPAEETEGLSDSSLVIQSIYS